MASPSPTIDIYDRDRGERTCSIALASAAPSTLIVLPDGRIVVRIAGLGDGQHATDRGHIIVYAPDGRLVQQIAGVTGPWDIATDGLGHLFVGSGNDAIQNGNLVPEPGKLLMYDTGSFTPMRSFDVSPDSFHGEFALSPDGKTIAALIYSSFGSRIDIYDVASAKLRLHIPLGSVTLVSLRFDGKALLVRSGSDPSGIWQIRSTATGRIVGTRTIDDESPTVIFKGVAYGQHLALSVAGPGKTTITIHDVRSGRMSKPIIVQGLTGSLYPVDPLPALAYAPDARRAQPPSFPTLAQIQATLPRAIALQFDDRVSGKKYTYLGDDARIDDPVAHTTTIVDCIRHVALFANTTMRTYRVVRMNAATLNEQGPPDPFYSNLGPSASATLSYENVSRAQLRSRRSTRGYLTHLSVAPFGPKGPVSRFDQEQEYASNITVEYPSCSRNIFGSGDFPGIEPSLEYELPSAADLYKAMPHATVHIVGNKPAVASALRVHVEFGTGSTIATKIDLRHIVRSSISAEQFMIPRGYANKSLPALTP